MVTLVLLCMTAGGCGVHVAGTRVRSVMETPSGKKLSIYRSSSFDTNKRDVPEDVVVQAMRASSMFFEEDVRAFAPAIVASLGKLEGDERLVVETSDTAIHVFVATNELQIVAFRDGQELSRHASAIPTAAVKTQLTPRQVFVPRPVPVAPPVETVASKPPAVEARPPSPPVEVRPPVDKPANKPASPSDKPKVVAKPKPKPVGPRLTEAEIRAKLDELDRLRARALITDDEYQRKRKALFDQL